MKQRCRRGIIPLYCNQKADTSAQPHDRTDALAQLLLDDPGTKRRRGVDVRFPLTTEVEMNELLACLKKLDFPLLVEVRVVMVTGTSKTEVVVRKINREVLWRIVDNSYEMAVQNSLIICQEMQGSREGEDERH